MMNNLQNINVFSEGTQKQLQDQLGAYTNQGLNYINNFYTPMLNDLKNDIARRFGNFDNAVFMNNLNGIESKRADSMSAFSQDIMAKQNELYNDELARRYNYINLLIGLQGDMDSKIMSYLGLGAKNPNTSSINTSALMNQLLKSTLNAYAPGSGNALGMFL
jgi:hypothetical protein